MEVDGGGRWECRENGLGEWEWEDEMDLASVRWKCGGCRVAEREQGLAFNLRACLVTGRHEDKRRSFRLTTLQYSIYHLSSDIITVCSQAAEERLIIIHAVHGADDDDGTQG